MNIILQNISKTFHSLRGYYTAVNDMSFEINDREFFVLLGPSGCGKSTTLNLIAGLETPSKGKIYFDNRIVASSDKNLYLPPKNRNVAMVFQSYALYPHLSVYDNIAFPLTILKQNKKTIRETVEDTSKRLKIDHLLSSYPAELSGGERQRVAIARAIVRKPSVFLLDEPLSNLDAQLRASTRNELKNLQQSLGITTVYVTHDQTEAMTLGDRIVLIKDGKIEQIGTPTELYDYPSSIFAASFIGSFPMNFFKASIKQDGKMFFLETESFSIPFKKPKDGKMPDTPEKTVTFGIRPEDIRVSKEPQPDSIRMLISSVEILGKDILLYFRVKNINLMAVTNERTFQRGDVVHVYIDIGKGHIFMQQS